MPSEFWGVDGALSLAMPGHLRGYSLLLLYGLLLAYALYRYFRDFGRLSSRQWLLTAGLSILSLFVVRLFPISLSSNPFVVLTPFASVPLLLAGAALNPAAALVVGVFSGLGRAVGTSQGIVWDLFIFPLAAVLAAGLMHQNYRGRLYGTLRHPLVGGIIAGVAVVVLSALATFVNMETGDGYGMALDRTLLTAGASFWALLLEGILGGGVVTLVLMGLPHLRPRLELVPPPAQLSLRRRLLTDFVLFAAFLTGLLVVVVFHLSVNVSTRLVVNQMMHNAETVSADLPGFQNHLQQVLAQYDNGERLLASDVIVKEQALKQLHRADPMFRRILLVDAEQGVVAAYPGEGEDELESLSQLEQEAVSEAFLTNAPEYATAQSTSDDHIVSFVVPVLNAQGATGAVLIGRVPQLSLENLIVGLQGTVGRGTGFIVDERSRIIAHPLRSQLLQEWEQPQREQALISTSRLEQGGAYRVTDGRTGTRELVVFTTSPTHPWKVVTTAPYAVVLNLALGIGGPLTLLLVLVMAAVYAGLAVMGNDITKPVSGLVEAARTIAAGGAWSPSSDVRRSDEIGQLEQAFNEMVRSRNKRLKELSLLLDVSHSVAANIDINQGMPAILRGALRGTGAAGARAVVLNPSGNYPLTYGEGPVSEAMAILDRPIMTKLRNASELILTTSDEIQSTLDLESAELPVPALTAIPLRSHGRFQGVLWLGYLQPHSYDHSSFTLLQTLAGQAAILVENARLFALAEGGRRRLMAVLASTTDAVIVTDQSARVLLINRAMESAFSLKRKNVVGRPVADVLKMDRLVRALTGEDAWVRNLEIINGEGRVFYTNAAPVIGRNGQALGRVAVLHDITHLKEMDQMKSDFVSTVSHDLRNPLTFMRGFVTMLPMVGEINESQEVYINKILAGIEQMTRLVSDLLDLGRIEAGVELRMETIDIEALLSDIATEHWQHAHFSGVKLQVDVGQEVPMIKGDPALIRQAITNLVMNGIKYAPNSGAMWLRAETLNGEVTISVQDSGPGIPEQAQIHLFEKFFRIKQRGTEQIKGSGLGLAIVKSIAEQHGGRAWCESEYGKGSTFSIQLPMEPTQDNDGERPQSH